MEPSRLAPVGREAGCCVAPMVRGRDDGFRAAAPFHQQVDEVALTVRVLLGATAIWKGPKATSSRTVGLNLPDPLAPSNATRLPSEITRLRSSTAVTPSYRQNPKKRGADGGGAASSGGAHNVGVAGHRPAPRTSHSAGPAVRTGIGAPPGWRPEAEAANAPPLPSVIRLEYS